MDRASWIVGGILAVGLVGSAAYFLTTRPQESADSRPEPQPVTSISTESSDETRLQAQSIDGVSKAFRWSAELPANWQAEWIPETEAINLYDPNAPGETTLEKSQVFIRSFEADEFLTLQTVQIHSREQLEVGGHPAVRYDIEKRPDVSDFANQPSWRNVRHTVTDVRVRDTNPSVFYVIAQRPDLADETYQQFLATFQVVDDTIPVGPAEPVAGFRDRVTLKPFGLRVSPRSSPVQPERFSGYHTGADIEFSDTEAEVEVHAIEQGTVTLVRVADGYGGVVVIKHDVDGTTYQVVYGHLDPATLPKLGQTVARGDVLGQLGEGGTTETDGERKHLHFAVYTGSQPNIRGYVSREADLKAWIDPLSLYQ